ncbi:protein FAM198B [Arapaima gigas]
MRFIRPGNIKRGLIFLPVTFLTICKCRRGAHLSKKRLLIASACFIYVFFVVFQVGLVLPWDKQKYRRTGRFHAPGLDEGFRDGSPTAQNEDLAQTASAKPNVVYITLKSKRQKPAIMRGTVRPKSRKKTGRNNPHNNRNVINSIGQINEVEWKQKVVLNSEASRISEIIIQNKLKLNENDGSPARNRHSAIRMYSRRAPPWFTREDVEALRFLADCKISRIKEVSSAEHRRLLLFESATAGASNARVESGPGAGYSTCQGRCGLIKRHVDTSEVFAFHLDRILGLNRSVPAVCRRFSFFKDSQPNPVVLWDSSLAPADSDLQSSIQLTWGSYQHLLKQKCWHKGVTPKPKWGCSSIHHYEWSKLALFDFLLQIYNRLDRNCCGFKPRKEDTCVKLGRHLECNDQDSIGLVHIVYRKHDPSRLVFIDNKGYFDRDEDNLDFKLLEGIKE